MQISLHWLPSSTSNSTCSNPSTINNPEGDATQGRPMESPPKQHPVDVLSATTTPQASPLLAEGQSWTAKKNDTDRYRHQKIQICRTFSPPAFVLYQSLETSEKKIWKKKTADLEFHSERVQVFTTIKAPIPSQRSMSQLTIQNSWLTHHVNNVNQQWFHAKIIYIETIKRIQNLWNVGHKWPFHSGRTRNKKSKKLHKFSQFQEFQPRNPWNHRHLTSPLWHNFWKPLS